MTIYNLQFTIASPLYKTAVDSFKKISTCANTLFSIIKEEGVAWKSFLANNSYIYKLYSISSNVTASIAKKVFTPVSHYVPPKIEDSNPSIEALQSNNKAWIQERSLLHKSSTNHTFSDEILLDIILSKGTDCKGVIHFAKKFCTHTGNVDLGHILIDWDKAYARQQLLQKHPEEIRKISGELAEKTQRLGEEQGRVLLLLEKKADYSTSPLSLYAKKLVEKWKPQHDRLYQFYYQNIKEKLQNYFNTSWKKRCFTEVQEEIRALLLQEYSELHQAGTLKHTLPASMQSLLVSEEEASSAEEITSLAALIWDLFLQNGLHEEVSQPLSLEKLNQIFEKEFSLITSMLESLALNGVNQLIENVGEETQLLLQLSSSKLPQKTRGWLEITPECDRYCEVNLCVRETSHPRVNMLVSGEAIPIVKYSYNKVPKHLLQESFFVDLLAGVESDENPIASAEKIKEFFSEIGKPVQTYVASRHSTFLQAGMLDEIKTYYSDGEKAASGSPEKVFFEMRMHAFVHYCASVHKNSVISEAILSNLEKSIEFLQGEAGRLHEAKQISDKEYLEAIATTLEVEEYTINHQRKVRAEQPEPPGKVIPLIITEQLRNLFSTISISELDIENIKSFANILLGKEMSEEIALLCKELPLPDKKVYKYNPPHLSLLKLMRALRVDLGNLRASPIALFKLYSDVNQLLSLSRTLITYVSCIPYLSILALSTNPVGFLAIVITSATLIRTLHALPYGKALLNLYKAVCTFHREAYHFLFLRLLMRLVQLSDIALHWGEKDPIQKARSLLKENISSKISFSLRSPLESISSGAVDELASEKVPSEIAPLQRFYPHLGVITDVQDPYKISDIVFPKLSMGFCIEEHNGAPRARLQGQSEFWLAGSITDTNLENADFSHVLLENHRGDKKICIVPRSPGRLFFQTLLRMCNGYSRKGIDLLYDFIINKLPKEDSTIFPGVEGLQESFFEIQPKVYYCDWVDGEIVSQDCDTIGYLLAHYIACGDVVRGQKLVDQLKTMKAEGKIEKPEVMLKTLERLTAAIPRTLSPDLVKIILQTCALCNEIPLESKAFPLFLRAYQSYVDYKEEKHLSYVTEEEESFLLRHLQEDSGIGPQVLRQVSLASSTVGSQAFFLFLSNIIEGASGISIFGKFGYVPASLKKYKLQQKYLKEDGDILSLLLGLGMNNLTVPYFAFSKAVVHGLSTLYQADKGQGDFFDILPTVLSKLNTENSNTKSDQSLLISPLIIMTLLIANKDKDARAMTLQTIFSTAQDMIALAVANKHGFCLEEKLSGLMQSIVGIPFETASLFDEYGVEKHYPSLTTRHLIRAGGKTVENFVETQNAYTKQEEIENSYWFPLQSLPIEYVNLQKLEETILQRYRSIADTFLEKQDIAASDTAPQLSFEGKSSMEEQVTRIVNWHESGSARESNRVSYFLNATQSSADLIQELQQAQTELSAMCARQKETIQNLLISPKQELSLLHNQVERYTGEIGDGLLRAEELQQQILANYESQSTLKKVGLGFLRYINSLVEVPTFGLVQFGQDQQIEILQKERSDLYKKVESIEAQKEQLFQNMVNTFKPRLSLGFNEVYTYFCQGKDTSIIQSLDLSDNQWKVIKEQLYRYMILQKYLSCAEHIKELYRSADRTIDENIDLIGRELDQWTPSIEKFPVRDIFLRSQVQLEKKLGNSVSSDIRNRISDLIGHSLKNYQAFCQLALSA